MVERLSASSSLQERCRVEACPQAVHLLGRKEEVEDSILQVLVVDRVSFCIARRPSQIQIAPIVQSKKRLEVPFQSIAAPMHRFYPEGICMLNLSDNSVDCSVLMVPQLLDLIPSF